jgi:hypothetical protein
MGRLFLSPQYNKVENAKNQKYPLSLSQKNSVPHGFMEKKLDLWCKLSLRKLAAPEVYYVIVEGGLFQKLVKYLLNVIRLGKMGS